LEEQRGFFVKEVDLPLALESDTGKWFPTSNSARQVRDQLFRLAIRRGVEMRFDCPAMDLKPPRGSGAWSVILRGSESIPASAVILASGGLSVPRTGSDGKGLELARRLGHEIHETYPALTPLTLDPPKYASLAGVSLKVRLEAPEIDQGLQTSRTSSTVRHCVPSYSAYSKRKLVTQGGFLFTHRGYSGPAVLDISHRAVLSKGAGSIPQPIYVQWGELGASEWEKALMAASGNLETLLRHHFPIRLAHMLLSEASLRGTQSVTQLRREQRRRLVELLTHFPLPWTGDEGYKKAEVTGGGAALNEVVVQTMESRIHPGLYLCGEMLDAFGPIGGYNFAWAWVTGRLAGLGASR
jgi:predicted Rossmann fold flavoprotein